MSEVKLSIITSIIVIAFSAIGLSTGFALNALQIDTIGILLGVCIFSAAYCFIVGEITRNNSQMDKLWSILPIIYSWIVAFKGGMSLRLVVMALLISAWGVRLTYNFGKKGAYSLKFWQGAEDYRWGYLRKQKYFSNRFIWAIFDLFFVAIYQNALVLATCLPMVAVMSSTTPFGFFDVLAAGLLAFFIGYETLADKQQMDFQTKKWDMINHGKELKDLPSPYNKGFNTKGLWAVSRHPNYFAEQAIWVCVYLFCISAEVTKHAIFNWSIVGSMFLILLFIGSSTLGEYISSKKYPEYKEYQKKVNRFIPGKKYE